MPGEIDLTELIRNMRPTLHYGTYCFCIWSIERPPEFTMVGSFREAEDWTVIVEESVALQHGLQPVFRAAWITLDVHSDLNAVGFLASVSRSLAAAGIPCNVVSAIQHDHLFVPVDLAVPALTVLNELMRTSGEPLDAA